MPLAPDPQDLPAGPRCRAVTAEVGGGHPTVICGPLTRRIPVR
ncbi:hypothetical protein AB0M46_25285 [Dactylosporangium sp. NPDC051485]